MSLRVVWSIYALMIVSLVFVVSYLFINFDKDYNWLVSESGAVQILSAIGYLIAFFLLIYYNRDNIGKHWYGLVVLLALFFRELDFDTRYFSAGLFTSSQYFTDRTGLIEKIVSAPIAIFLVATLIYLFARYFKHTLRGVLTMSPVSWFYCSALNLAALSVVLDGLKRRLGLMDIEVSWKIDAQAGTIEEAIELFIPLCIILGLISHYNLIKVKQLDIPR